MVEVRLVDYRDPHQGAVLVELLNGYAKDQWGGSEPLSQSVKESLAERLADVPGARSFIAWEGDTPIGLLNSFTGFSTFAAKPLINIHDVFVKPEARGKGVLDALFAAVEKVARENGCCKITLEVLQDNARAQRGYQRLGYKGYELGESGGEALFWQKKLS